jgi:replicative DNA helicase
MLEAGVPDLVSLGIPEVDKSIGGGVAFGEIVLVAARPSHGKSAFALQVVNYQTSQGIPCAFMSEEMSSMSLGKRCTQFLSSVPQESWGKRPEAVKIQIAQHFQDRAPCHIIEHSRTAEKVADEVCKLAKNEGVKTVVVDYVQLLTNGKGSRYETVTESSVILKQACSESGVLMISLAQMGRQIEGRDSFMPKMSDLKESGQLEQDADVILFLVWPHRLDSSKPANEYFVYPAKNRNREIVYPVVRMDFEPRAPRAPGGQPDPMRTSVDMMAERGGRRGGGYQGNRNSGGGGGYGGGGGFGGGQGPRSGGGGGRGRGGPGGNRGPAGR